MLGSHHRYSKRTEHQALVEGRRSARSSQKFDRIPSRRRNRRRPIGGAGQFLHDIKVAHYPIPISVLEGYD